MNTKLVKIPIIILLSLSAVVLCSFEDIFLVELALVLEAYAIFELVRVLKNDPSFILPTAIISAICALPVAVAAFFYQKFVVSACIVFVLVAVILLPVHLRRQKKEQENSTDKVKWYVPIIAFILLIPTVAGSLVFADGIRAIVQFQVPVLQLMAPDVRGAEYYESGDFVKYRFGEAVAERFPKKEELSDAVSIDFAHDDYTIIECYFMETSVRYFLSVKYPEDVYTEKKTALSSSVTKAEKNGNFEIYLLEQSKVGIASYLSYFACVNNERDTIIYLAIIDDRKDKNSFDDFNTASDWIINSEIWVDADKEALDEEK